MIHLTGIRKKNRREKKKKKRKWQTNKKTSYFCRDCNVPFRNRRINPLWSRMMYFTSSPISSRYSPSSHRFRILLFVLLFAQFVSVFWRCVTDFTVRLLVDFIRFDLPIIPFITSSASIFVIMLLFLKHWDRTGNNPQRNWNSTISDCISLTNKPRRPPSFSPFGTFLCLLRAFVRLRHLNSFLV